MAAPNFLDFTALPELDIYHFSAYFGIQFPPKTENKTHFRKLLPFSANQIFSSTSSNSSSDIHHEPKSASNSKLFTATSSSSVSTELEVGTDHETGDGKFDWYSQWYPVMPVCDLDKRVPHGKKVIGLDVVVWWDRNESDWKVFDDSCPHRLAPLSEGRIDQWGRLQCVYHGWCFNGSGDCNFIPQAPSDGPQFHTFKKACAAAYPSTVQNGILWFWPNTDPQYKDILSEKKPAYIPELNDPSYSKSMGNREFPFGYEVLLENLMDPSHVPYAHYGLLQTRQPENKADREGGRPMDMRVEKLDKYGFIAKPDWVGTNEFISPCVFYSHSRPLPDQGNEAASSAGTKKSSVERGIALVFFAVPVTPGKSRLIWATPRNFATWIDKIVPRWIFHLGQNTILDSDLYLLHVEERKIQESGSAQWHKTCFLPTKADALVLGFRKWFNKYAGGQVDWRGKYSGALPPSPPREQLMDRYWSHVVNCPSCAAAYKGLNILKVVLQLVSVALIGILAITTLGETSMAKRTTMVSLAVLCFAASKWLARFVYKNFHFHDYIHAFH
ncbi:protochlorophyllide-dependent translocon component 52, chloroplastic [Morus notabilis]|uniref:protochlorophyllide-dependent translocon component 52, chloroplastic n=1 Tax=Morus notabilis TaxID=981085 RepID=UPI000CED0EB1|nr:protochlorophyllide-dependent translocon component 52, chloroplastic [Morus notabilis]